MLTVVAAGFLQGIFSSFHCIGMCGPLAAATLDRNESFHLSHFFYQTGRGISYIIIGLFFGLVSTQVNKFGFEFTGIQYFSAILAIVISLIIFLMIITKNSKSLNTGWLFKKIIQPIQHHKKQLGIIFPFLLGLASGLLPCGVLYSGYAIAFGSGDILLGGLTMFGFYAGTLPVFVTTVIGWFYVQKRIPTNYLTMIALTISIISIGAVAFRSRNLYTGKASTPPCHEHKHN
jgi:sulfite exporter TauE/SafE